MKKKRASWVVCEVSSKEKMIKKTAVNQFDLSIQAGEFVGLIGPNGAGKTTLMKMLTGIIAPTSGHIEVLGYTPSELNNTFKKQFAIVMGQKSQLFPDISAADTFLLLKEIYDIEESVYRKNLEMFTELFQLKDYLNVQVRTLSLGERMKLELVASLLHDPKVLFLDEPTLGLDAVAQKQIRQFLKEVNRLKGTTILLTSHYMDDIKRLCDRCVVINHGEKIYDGGLVELFGRYQTHQTITITFEEATEYEKVGNMEVIEENPFKLSFVAPRKEVRHMITHLLNTYEVDDIAIEEEDIGNVVERIYQEKGGHKLE
jgi:ABC-2 type transport system ATP-binding protein